MAEVDGIKKVTYLKGLDQENNYGVTANVTSLILIGGNVTNILRSTNERLISTNFI